MDIKINANQGVPIVITESVVKRSKVVKRQRIFKGISQGFSALFDSFFQWASTQIEESFFDEKIEVVDEGLKDQKHYAITILEETDPPLLQAIEVPFKPPCVHHYEIIRYEAEESAKKNFVNSGGTRQSSQTSDIYNKDQDEILESLRSRLGE